MKMRIGVVLGICFCIGVLPLATAFSARKSVSENEKVPIVDLTSQDLEFNLGKVRSDTLVKVQVAIRNRLDEDLVLNEVQSTCACISGKIVSQTVRSGDVFDLEIYFDSTGYLGATNHTLYLLAENVNYTMIRIGIKVFVEEPQQQR